MSEENNPLEGLQYFTKPIEELKEMCEKLNEEILSVKNDIEDMEMDMSSRISKNNDRANKQDDCSNKLEDKLNSLELRLDRRLQAIEDNLKKFAQLNEKMDNLDKSYIHLDSLVKSQGQKLELFNKLAVRFDEFKEKHDKELELVKAYFDKQSMDVNNAIKNSKDAMEKFLGEKLDGVCAQMQVDLNEKELKLGHVNENCKDLEHKNRDLDRKVELLYSQLNDKINKQDRGLNEEDVRVLIKKYKFA